MACLGAAGSEGPAPAGSPAAAPSAPPAQAVAAPASGGAALIRAIEAGPQLVVGVVTEPRSLDAHGWTAQLQVERALAGSAQPGQVIRIGWEELARSRPPRFAAGSRAVIALGPLPSSSLWRQRFPEPGALAVAADSQAFLLDPDAGTLALLERWAQIGATDREGPSGVAVLAQIWAGAVPSVAESAFVRLSEVPGLDGKVYGEAATAFAAGLTNPSRPLRLRADLVRLAGERHLGALQPTLEALAKRGDPLEAPALDALGALEGGLPPDQVRSLLSRPEPAVRAVGVRQARGPQLEIVQRLVKGDASPEVRAAAVVVLLDQQGMDAFDLATPGLFDSDTSVRSTTAQRIAQLGAPAVPRLVALLQPLHMPEAAAPIAALALEGSEGHAAVQTISTSHPDPAVRKVALLALGKLDSGH